MSNHFHLAVESLKINELSSYVGKICELYSRHFHKRRGGCGTLWQGRYKSTVVQKEGYLIRLGRFLTYVNGDTETLILMPNEN